MSAIRGDKRELFFLWARGLSAPTEPDDNPCVVPSVEWIERASEEEIERGRERELPSDPDSFSLLSSARPASPELSPAEAELNTGSVNPRRASFWKLIGPFK